jgi:hypothetical protein
VGSRRGCRGGNGARACLQLKQNGYSAGVNVIKGGAFQKQYGEPERMVQLTTLGGRRMEVGLVDNL